MLSFFNDSDFDAFDKKLAYSDNSKVIADRQFVANKLKTLHQEGLQEFFEDNGLYPHWKKEHLTNILWPFPAANGGYVDFVRIGYGKEETLIKELAKRIGLKDIYRTNVILEQVAFHHITRLQIGLNYNGWWINLYIDRSGWIEQKNLIVKVKSSNQNEVYFKKLLKNIINDGYSLVIYSHNFGKNIVFDNEESFINKIEKLNREKHHFNISIEKFHYRKDKNNNKNYIMNYLRKEFLKLLPLYHFIAWTPKNNYINI